MAIGRVVRAPGNFTPDVNSEAHVTELNPEDGMTQQQFANDADINTIMRRVGMLGGLPPMVGGVYGDFTGISDYQSAAEALAKAQAGFLEIPPEVREQFDNDPANFLDWAAGRSEDEISSLVERATTAGGREEIVTEPPAVRGSREAAPNSAAGAAETSG